MSKAIFGREQQCTSVSAETILPVRAQRNVQVVQALIFSYMYRMGVHLFKKPHLLDSVRSYHHHAYKYRKKLLTFANCNESTAEFP